MTEFDRQLALITKGNTDRRPQNPVCRRCRGDTIRSLRACLISAIMELQNTFQTKQLYEAVCEKGEACARCYPRDNVALNLYHLAQDGVVIKVSRGRYSKRLPQ
jgi:hypothetical protein